MFGTSWHFGDFQMFQASQPLQASKSIIQDPCLGVGILLNQARKREMEIQHIMQTQLLRPWESRSDLAVSISVRIVFSSAWSPQSTFITIIPFTYIHFEEYFGFLQILGIGLD